MSGRVGFGRGGCCDILCFMGKRKIVPSRVAFLVLFLGFTFNIKIVLNHTLHYTQPKSTLFFSETENGMMMVWEKVMWVYIF